LGRRVSSRKRFLKGFIRHRVFFTPAVSKKAAGVLFLPDFRFGRKICEVIFIFVIRK